MTPLVELNKISYNPEEVIKIIDTNINYKVDIVKLYNTIFSTGYTIDQNTIDKVLMDIDWQSVVVYGLNLCLLLPTHPSNYVVILYMKYEMGIDFDNLIEEIKNNQISQDEIKSIYNDFIYSLINNEDKFTKMIVFKALLDITSLVISNFVSYSMSDKNIEDELKKKLLPM